ncbi:Endoglucanase precursor [compost metagenome]
MINTGANGVGVVDIGSSIRTVNIPFSIVPTLSGRSLELNGGDIALTIPNALLNSLAAQLPVSEQSGGKLVLRVVPLGDAEANALLDIGRGQQHSGIKLSGKLYDLHLDLVPGGGTTTSLKQFSEALELRLKLDASLNPRLAGIYYIAPDGSLEYVGGQVKDGYISAPIGHFSQYAVLEFSKLWSDLPASHWAYYVIMELTAKQILNGTGAATFEPGRSVTRAEFTAMLVHALKLTERGDLPFADVPSQAWYADSINLAYKAGIINGKSSTLFDPSTTITREEMVVMTMKAYALLKGSSSATVSGTGTAVQPGFKDSASISPWALNEVKAAASLKLVKGRSADEFAPKSVSTRAEAAQVIYNLIQPE